MYRACCIVQAFDLQHGSTHFCPLRLRVRLVGVVLTCVMDLIAGNAEIGWQE
jgi:hypothetical protein